MIIPAKHENIQKGSIVLGANVIVYLKQHRSENIERLFQLFKDSAGISLDEYCNILTILWLGSIIIVEDYRVYLK